MFERAELGRICTHKSKMKQKGLLLMTDHAGQIVHIAGSTRLLGYKAHEMYLQNFFNFISPQSKELLFKTCSNGELLPMDVNFVHFQALFKMKRQPQQESHSQKQLEVDCYRSYVAFGEEMELLGQAQIQTYQNNKQVMACNKTVKEVIVIYVHHKPQTACRRCLNLQELILKMVAMKPSEEN